jgi:hypothetical protein
MADKLEEVDFLRSQLLDLRLELARRERETWGKDMVAKYGLPGETKLTILADGTIVRAVIESAEKDKE